MAQLEGHSTGEWSIDRTLYQTIESATQADQQALAAAYRRLAARHHPDAGGDAGRMAEINRAWRVLGRPERRMAYDCCLRVPSDAGSRGISMASNMLHQALRATASQSDAKRLVREVLLEVAVGADLRWAAASSDSGYHQEPKRRRVVIPSIEVVRAPEFMRSLAAVPGWIAYISPVVMFTIQDYLSHNIEAQSIRELLDELEAAQMNGGRIGESTIDMDSASNYGPGTGGLPTAVDIAKARYGRDCEVWVLAEESWCRIVVRKYVGQEGYTGCTVAGLTEWQREIGLDPASSQNLEPAGSQGQEAGCVRPVDIMEAPEPERVNFVQGVALSVGNVSMLAWMPGSIGVNSWRLLDVDAWTSGAKALFFASILCLAICAFCLIVATGRWARNSDVLGSYHRGIVKTRDLGAFWWGVGICCVASGGVLLIVMVAWSYLQKHADRQARR
ncbi:MAG: DnaJ domain-containing protein [Chloroflexota bacterium]